MGDKEFYWLIGAKIVCCGALFLVLTGVLSLAAIAAFLSSNALVLAGTVLVVAAVFVQRQISRRRATERQAFTDAPQPERAPASIPDA